MPRMTKAHRCGARCGNGFSYFRMCASSRTEHGLDQSYATCPAWLYARALKTRCGIPRKPGPISPHTCAGCAGHARCRSFLRGLLPRVGSAVQGPGPAWASWGRERAAWRRTASPVCCSRTGAWTGAIVGLQAFSDRRLVLVAHGGCPAVQKNMCSCAQSAEPSCVCPPDLLPRHA